MKDNKISIKEYKELLVELMEHHIAHWYIGKPYGQKDWGHHWSDVSTRCEEWHWHVRWFINIYQSKTLTQKALIVVSQGEKHLSVNVIFIRNKILIKKKNMSYKLDSLNYNSVGLHSFFLEEIKKEIGKRFFYLSYLILATALLSKLIKTSRNFKRA